MSIIPHEANSFTAETKVCTIPDHAHKDPHVDIIRFTLRDRRVIIESERWSLIYRVFIDGDLVREQITGAQLNAYMRELSNG